MLDVQETDENSTSYWYVITTLANHLHSKNRGWLHASWCSRHVFFEIRLMALFLCMYLSTKQHGADGSTCWAKSGNPLMIAMRKIAISHSETPGNSWMGAGWHCSFSKHDTYVNENSKWRTAGHAFLGQRSPHQNPRTCVEMLLKTWICSLQLFCHFTRSTPFGASQIYSSNMTTRHSPPWSIRHCSPWASWPCYSLWWSVSTRRELTHGIIDGCDN